MDTAAVNNSYQEASDMLAEALKQMDGILAGTLKREHKTQNGLVENGSPKLCHSPQQSRAISLLNDVHMTLDSVEDKGRIFRQLPPDTQVFFQQWIGLGSPAKLMLSNGYPSTENLEDKVRRLETDKDNLSLQVSVLTDQIEVQVEKIHDLEKLTRSCRNGNMTPTSEHSADINGDFNDELLNRNMAGHDMHKLDLMAENSNLKLRLAGLEREKNDYDSKLQYAQRRIDDLQSRLNDQTIEVNELRMRIAKNGTIPSSPDTSDTRDRTLEREKTLDRLKRKHTEVERLKRAVESLLVTNSEKDHHIEDLMKQVKKYRRLEDIILTTQGGKALENLSLEDTDSNSTHHSNGSPNDTIIQSDRERYDNIDQIPPDLRHIMLPNATSTPVTLGTNSPKTPVRNIYQTTIPTSQYTNTTPSPRRSGAALGIGRSSSCENVKPKNGSPASSHRPAPALYKHWYSEEDSGAQTETDEEALKDEMAQEYIKLQRQSNDHPKKHKNRGIKRFFGKLRRSNSQEMDPNKLEDFKRSGLRATAGARLGWSRDLKYSDADVPFSRWDTDRVSAWLHGLGLSMYVGECKRWVKNGDQLLNATPHDLEKEMGVRNHFHRKKIQLALQSFSSESRNGAEDLDFNWVTRWLDDIGLPQYKDSFLDARVDGRMLHQLTVEDLVTLKVTNTLHHLSIRQGIHVLRMNDFNGACLKRRPVPEEDELQNAPHEVMLWTNHRVMEWLRSIDLSEYAPNLRGSGVHGGLMVREPRFSYEIFASLLSIPSNKTLLRRHLSTHYVALIGSDMQHKKREVQSATGYIPLTPNQKVKLKKRLFSHRRTKSETEEELVCPLEKKENGSIVTNGHTNGSSPASQGTPKQEKENMLAKDRFLDNVPTSDV